MGGKSEGGGGILGISHGVDTGQLDRAVGFIDQDKDIAGLDAARIFAKPSRGEIIPEMHLEEKGVSRASRRFR
jgi:hypothetical protein